MPVQHHIRLGAEHLRGNGDIGRYVLLPGELERAARIAEGFDNLEVLDNPRGYNAHLGTLESDRGSIDVLTIPSGVGSASVEVVVRELLACGARRLVRVGSCGTMTASIRPGQVVIATGAVRDERTTDHYAPREFPALSHPDAVAAMCEGARRAELAGETFRGVCHSKASLYAREFGYGPAGEENLSYMRWLRRCGVVVTEMEVSSLLILAATAPGETLPLNRTPGSGECQAVAVLAVFATDDSNMEIDETTARLAEERAICVALEGVRAWAKRDRKRRRQPA